MEPKLTLVEKINNYNYIFYNVIVSTMNVRNTINVVNSPSVLTYTIKFNKNLQINKKHAIKKIRSVLSDKRGWKALGYTFLYRDDNCSCDFVINFASNQYITQLCNFSGLSCANMNKLEIYINIDRWRHGSSLSKLNLDNYRTYVINHEVGHILGRLHTTCKGTNNKVPVMVQQTLGIGDCRPNPWPLKFE